jgi:hypothetical protein
MTPPTWIALARGQARHVEFRLQCYDLAVNLYDELRALLAAFDQAGIDYALVGALAVAVWGAPRATKDIDLLIMPADRARAVKTAGEQGFTLAALPMEFKDGTEVQRVSKIDPSGTLLTLDLMMVDRLSEAAWASRRRLAFADSQISVVSRETLMEMKARAARPHDLMDIQNLKDGDR